MVRKELRLELDVWYEDYVYDGVHICATGLAKEFGFGFDHADLPRIVTLIVTDEKREGVREFTFINEPPGRLIMFRGGDSYAIYNSFGRWLEQYFIEGNSLWMSVEER